MFLFLFLFLSGFFFFLVTFWLRNTCNRPGITNKLLGYEHFLSEHPSWVGRIVLVQYGIQCKHRGEDYDKTRVEVAKLVTRINRRYTGSSDGGRRPCVIYREVTATALSFEDRLALWKATDIMLVCPRREGLNLLPFEYLSSRPTFGASTEKPGVLLLSEFCSCCFVLSGAIKFNPYHTQSVSRAINDALHLSDEEKDERWRDCYDWVQQNPVSLWAERVLLDLKNARKNPMEFAYEVSSPRCKNVALVLWVAANVCCCCCCCCCCSCSCSCCAFLPWFTLFFSSPRYTGHGNGASVPHDLHTRRFYTARKRNSDQCLPSFQQPFDFIGHWGYIAVPSEIGQHPSVHECQDRRRWHWGRRHRREGRNTRQHQAKQRTRKTQ